MGGRIAPLIIAVVMLMGGAARAETTVGTGRSTEPVHPVTQRDDSGLDSESIAGEIRGYATALGISEEAARSLFFFQNETIDLIRVAEASFPSTYAGAWIANHARGGELMIAFSSDAEASALQVALRASNPARIRGVAAAHNVQALRAARERARAAFALRADSLGWFGMSIHYPTNKLRLSVVEPTKAVITELKDRIGSEFVTVVGERPFEAWSIPPSSFTCETYIRSCNPLRGGTNAELSDGRAVCSLGFNATRRLDGQPMIVSAGHCDDSVYHSRAAVGPMWAQSLEGPADAQSIHVTNGWSRGRWIISHTNVQAFAITGVYRGNALSSGFMVCHTGQESGPFVPEARCGRVEDGDWEGTNSFNKYLYNQFRYGIVGFPGDSGGPVYSYGAARGIIVGGISGSFTVASYAVHVENTTGVDIRIN